MIANILFKVLVVSNLANTVLAALGPVVDVNICKVVGAANPASNYGLHGRVVAGFDHKKNQTLNAAPWTPDCKEAPTDDARWSCSQCQGLAAISWGVASAGCAGASGACLFGYIPCEISCEAAASFAFYSALRACYCANIDCSAKGVSNSKGNFAPHATFGYQYYVALNAAGGLAPIKNEWKIADPTKAIKECTYREVLFSPKSGYGWL